MYAIPHPSQPNYIAMIAHSMLNHGNNDYFSTNELTIVDLLNRAKVSWKSFRRHNPFMFSISVRNYISEYGKIVNADQLEIDLGNDTDLIYAAFMRVIDYLYPGLNISKTFNRYSLTKLLEENWGLGNLDRNDAIAPSIMDIWRPKTILMTVTTIITPVTDAASYHR